ncbi:MAG: hypothetical protein V1809_03905 [Planctomycetota bacterium]
MPMGIPPGGGNEWAKKIADIAILAARIPIYVLLFVSCVAVSIVGSGLIVRWAITFFKRHVLGI